MGESQHELLVEIPVLRDLSPEDVDNLGTFLSEVWLEPGDVVFEEGDESNFVAFVLNGRLEVLKASLDGDAKVIATISRGNSIGEMSMLDDLKRSATVRAKEKTLLHLLRRTSSALSDNMHL